MRFHPAKLSSAKAKSGQRRLIRLTDFRRSSRFIQVICVPQRDAQDRVASLCLICGTSLERIAPESLTRPCRNSFTAISRHNMGIGTLDLVMSCLGRRLIG